MPDLAIILLVRNGCLPLWGSMACTVCTSRFTCVWVGRYVLIYLVLQFMLLIGLRSHLSAPKPCNVVFRCRTCQVCRRAPMVHGIGFKIFTSFVIKDCRTCVACTCGINENVLICMVMLECMGV